MSASPVIRIASPAKVNLGLEILGKRDDGYHEIRSVLAMVDLCDDIVFTRLTGHGRSRISGMPGVPDEGNLILKAIRAFNTATSLETAWQVDVTKRIPAPSGLGGASSNAACTLFALNHAAGNPLASAELYGIAAQLGSDVPFFLGTPAALVTGTGTDLTPVAAPRGWVLICAPKLDIEAKTARLYSSLAPSDFSDGRRVHAAVDALTSRGMPGPQSLSNAFARPLEALLPSIGRLREDMRTAGVEFPILSGAGPAHYAIFPDEATALETRERLTSITHLDIALHVAPFRDDPIAIGHASS